MEPDGKPLPVAEEHKHVLAVAPADNIPVALLAGKPLPVVDDGDDDRSAELCLLMPTY